MAVDHYENFPVASWLLPGPLREPVRHIYRFARSADDIADEGQASPAQRLALLGGYRAALATLRDGQPLSPADPCRALFEPLGRTIRQHALPFQPFFDLLSAFEQDVTVHRYADYGALLDYCSRSANPVGRLMLHLYGANDDESLRQSDALCTGLQLANFWQDVALDRDKGRLYLPQDALARHGVDEADIAHGRIGPAWRGLMREQADLARTLLWRGGPLAHRLGGRIGFELRLVVHGGLRILERLEQLHYDIFTHRPTLGRADWALLFWRALRHPRTLPGPAGPDHP